MVKGMKVIVVGNGIDIQFGGIDRRGNKAIIERAIANIESDKYLQLGWDILETCVSAINMAIQKRISIPKDQDYLFLQMEIERIRRLYQKAISVNEIGLEDIFLGAELLYVNAIDDDERNTVDTAINDYLQPLLLDAIYDNNTVNDIYKLFPNSFSNYSEPPIRR